ncbi:MAG: site-specific integrase [Sphingobacteriales bacterium]|nr:site-specific integrase [Sphingobacteriales bacterium]
MNYNGNTLKVYTGEAILPKHWNQDTNSARNTPKFPEHPEFNERLNHIRSTISRVFMDYKNRNDHATPAPAILKPLIEGAMKKGSERTTFISYFEDFVSRSFTGQRIDPKSKMPIRHGVAKGYQTTLNHLKTFAKVWKRKLDFETIDLEFHKDFTNYLTAAPVLLSANTVGSNIQRIKAVLAEATEKGVNSNRAYKSKYFVKQEEAVDTIYLDEGELKEMRALDLSKNPRLENVRNQFLIGCYTGLRFSDFSILKPENIKDGFIRITQTKTGKPVIIPVHSIVKGILQKYNGLPRSISNVKLNAYLKELGQLMPSLKKTETKTTTKGGVKVAKTLEKWELLTTHTARRSFATNEYKAGTPSITIMAITGHKTEKSFLKYIRVTTDEHARILQSSWTKRGMKAV